MVKAKRKLNARQLKCLLQERARIMGKNNKKLTKSERISQSLRSEPNDTLDSSESFHEQNSPYYLTIDLQNAMDDATASILKISDQKTLQLIDLYHKEECLWNTHIEDYKDESKRSLAALRIGTVLDLPNFTAQHVVMKFKELWATYREEQERINSSKAAGDVQVYTPRVIWYSKMDALQKRLNRLEEALKLKSSLQPPSTVEFVDLGNPGTSTKSVENSRDAKRKKYETRKSRTDDRNKNEEKNIARSLRDIQSQLKKLTSRNDDFHDTFGKYVASLMRKVSPEKALTLQPQIISLITGEMIVEHPDLVTEELVFKIEPED